MKKLILSLLGALALLVAAHAEMKLGLQTYTFRKNTLVETFVIAQNLGIRYLQVYPGQELGGGFEGKMGPGMNQATRDAVWKLAKEHGLEIVSFGVTKPKNEAAWRELLAFAKERGIKEIESEPPAADLPMINKLGAEYGVRIGCHNHALGSVYANADDGLAAVKPFKGQWVWLAPDTGHWVRSGYDPVERLHMAQGCLTSLHMKDLNGKAPGMIDFKASKESIPALHDVPWGSGASNAAGQIAELRKQGFDGYVYIEYEVPDRDLYDNVAKCVDYFNRAQAADLKGLEAGKVPPAAAVPADKARKPQTVVNFQ